MTPEKILLKTSPLTPRELKIIEQHPVYSHNLLSTINFLRPALDISYCHHENLDGTGYPRNLKGDGIPIAARIFAVTEAWENMTHDHRGRKALNDEEALFLISEQAGKQFDPRVAAAFHKMIKKT